MKIENIIRRVLREEQEEQILKIPGLKFFNNDWNILQKFLESQGNPRYSIGGDLNLWGGDIKSLGNLVRVEGSLDLGNTMIESLGNLEYVGNGLNLENCFNLKSLGKLKHVGSWLDLGRTKLKSLGELKHVGSWLDLAETNVKTLGNLEYVGGDLDIYNTPLTKKYTREKEIRNMVEVVGKIFIYIYGDRKYN
jgi:hypothetical protein